MKTLLKHNLMYYTKNRTKIILAIAFIFSFIGMIFVYDTLELTNISNDADTLRAQGYAFYYNSPFEILPEEALYLYETDPDDYTAEQLALQELSDAVHTSFNKLYILHDNLATTYAGGRLNAELTPYRLSINTELLNLLNLVDNDEGLAKMFSNLRIDRKFLETEQIRLERLMDTLTPDDFNEYTLTAHNFMGRVFQGVFLFMILIVTLFLYYDLFSKDYDHRTYQILFSEPIKRKAIFQSKILFAIIYTFTLITVGILISIIYLALQKRIGYNIVPSRVGYMFHPMIININPLTIFKFAPVYVIIPMIIYNVISAITGILIILFWIIILLTLSSKLRSSANTLTFSVFVLIAVFFFNLTPIGQYLAYVFPLFNYNFYNSLNGINNMNFMYIWLLSGVYSYLTYRLYIKDVETIDLLGGDYND